MATVGPRAPVRLLVVGEDGARAAEQRLEGADAALTTSLFPELSVPLSRIFRPQTGRVSAPWSHHA